MKRGNQYYSVEADQEINRVHFVMQGEIPEVEAVTNFEADWHTTVGELKPGFTILGDLSKCAPLPEDVEALNQKVQGWIMQQGCSKVAQLVGDLTVMSQVNAFAERSGMKNILRAFNIRRTAEMWLDMK
ncbi:MAG: hypothetical protein CEE43_00750 [Promethearchaeota archaeon Loki_b32]|nr:MAG: hypothetical protein CEE43_00750 [Candidatus Lokiarchaeota archaeon Loki_b32]